MASQEMQDEIVDIDSRVERNPIKISNDGFSGSLRPLALHLYV